MPSASRLPALYSTFSGPAWRDPSKERADLFHLGDFTQTIGHPLITCS